MRAIKYTATVLLVIILLEISGPTIYFAISNNGIWQFLETSIFAIYLIGIFITLIMIAKTNIKFFFFSFLSGGMSAIMHFKIHLIKDGKFSFVCLILSNLFWMIGISIAWPSLLTITLAKKNIISQKTCHENSECVVETDDDTNTHAMPCVCENNVFFAATLYRTTICIFISFFMLALFLIIFLSASFFKENSTSITYNFYIIMIIYVDCILLSFALSPGNIALKFRQQPMSPSFIFYIHTFLCSIILFVSISGIYSYEEISSIKSLYNFYMQIVEVSDITTLVNFKDITLINLFLKISLFIFYCNVYVIIKRCIFSPELLKRNDNDILHISNLYIRMHEMEVAKIWLDKIDAITAESLVSKAIVNIYTGSITIGKQQISNAIYLLEGSNPDLDVSIAYEVFFLSQIRGLSTYLVKEIQTLMSCTKRYLLASIAVFALLNENILSQNDLNKIVKENGDNNASYFACLANVMIRNKENAQEFIDKIDMNSLDLVSEYFITLKSLFIRCKDKDVFDQECINKLAEVYNDFIKISPETCMLECIFILSYFRDIERSLKKAKVANLARLVEARKNIEQFHINNQQVRKMLEFFPF